MSLWTDIRDTVEAPFTAAAGFVGDVVSGKNIFDSAGQLAQKEFMAGFGGASLVVSKTPLRSVLDSKIANTLTFGVSGDAVTIADKNIDVAHSGYISKSDALGYDKLFAKDTAIVGAAVLTAGAVAPAGGITSVGQFAQVGAAGLSGGGLGSKLASGDVNAIASTALQYSGVATPSDAQAYVDTYHAVADTVSQYIPAGGSGGSPTVVQTQPYTSAWVSSQASTVGGYASTTGIPTKNTALLVGVGLVAALFIFSRGKV